MYARRLNVLVRLLASPADRRAAIGALAAGVLSAALAMTPRFSAESKPKKCKKPNTKCGKTGCCTAGTQVCANGKCAAACQFTKTATTWTLKSDCTTTTTIEIPDGVTLDGNGKTINLVGPIRTPFDGPGLLSAAGATTIAVRDVRLNGAGLTGSCDALSYAAIAMFAPGEIDDITIVDLPCGAGIYVQTVGEVAIRDSRIDNVEVGVFANNGNVTATGNTLTNVINGFGASSPPESVQLIASDNTVVGRGNEGAPGLYYGPHATGSAGGNVISNFLGTNACGIRIDADAGAVTLGANTFPNPPGNEQNVCDLRE